ncbi:MAG: HEAT repeat domain-containing protein, partial [Chloroflexia bacterium]|nr:HEAT repeat domain-containing protein [Chloroflexia bacterium]
HLAHTVGMREQVVTALRRALWAEQRCDVARFMLITLARLSHPVEELAALLQATELDLQLRLMALAWIGSDSAVQRMFGERLVQQRDEPAIRAAMLEQLGHPAIPTTVVGALARDGGEDPLVRYAAIAALGRSLQYEAQTSLLALVCDPAEADEIRLAALEALPATLTEASMSQLRQLFHQHQDGALALAIARVLARNHEATGLACLLDAGQSASGPEILAVLDVLGLLDDPQITPVLTRLSQRSAVAPAVRLAALAALVRRGEQDVLPLLQRYLTDPSPPVRVQAYTLLEEFAPANLRLEDPLDDPDAPLVLRLKALTHRAERSLDPGWLCALTGKSDQPLALRLAAIAALARATEPIVVVRLEALLHIPQGLPEHPLPIIRRQCLATLGCLAQGDGACAEAAMATLARLSCEAGPVTVQRSWASAVLLEAMGQGHGRR